MTCTHLLVANPTAQSGKNAARIERVRALLVGGGVTCDVLATAPEGRTTAAVAGAIEAGAFACVIAMGGDGTFREVAAGILESTKKDAVPLRDDPDRHRQRPRPQLRPRGG